jgi:hypothetical protein
MADEMVSYQVFMKTIWYFRSVLEGNARLRPMQTAVNFTVSDLIGVPTAYVTGNSELLIKDM